MRAMSTKKSKFNWFAFILLTMIPLWFGLGQEIHAIAGNYDDYYFLLRAASLKLNGSHLAPIKELLYPLFIRASWVLGLGLRNVTVLCYGFSLFILWGQIAGLAKSRLVAWCTVLPLSLFSYQHMMFSRVLSGALLLVLLPLVFSASIYLFRKKSSWLSVAFAGVVAGLMILTRPEGALFILPPCVSFAFVLFGSGGWQCAIHKLKSLMPKGIVFLVIVFSFQQVACAVNWHYFGFWAPTIMKAASYQQCLKALMSIDPGVDYKVRYAAVPKSSFEKAYAVSPSFLRAKPFFDKHAERYSKAAYTGYRPVDGSIGGGHFQWALLDAGAFVAGKDSVSMLEYFEAVSKEINEGLGSGVIKGRRFFSTALGPDFSFLDRKFWLSAWGLLKRNLNLIPPTLPEMTTLSSRENVEFDFNRIALRRTGLIESSDLSLSGWIVSPGYGIPDGISLDHEAVNSGSVLQLKERPDVAEIMCGLDPAQVPPAMCGFEISLPSSLGGNLRIVSNGKEVLIPLERFRSLIPGDGIIEPSIRLHIERKSSFEYILIQKILTVTANVTKAVFYVIRILIFGGLVLLGITFFCSKIPILRIIDRTTVFFLSSLVASVVFPRLFLFAAINANMYPGTEYRYLTPNSFAVWLFSGFMVTFFVYSLCYKKR